jgi:hypothetical protein
LNPRPTKNPSPATAGDDYGGRGRGLPDGRVLAGTGAMRFT